MRPQDEGFGFGEQWEARGTLLAVGRGSQAPIGAECAKRAQRDEENDDGHAPRKMLAAHVAPVAPCGRDLSARGGRGVKRPRLSSGHQCAAAKWVRHRARILDSACQRCSHEFQDV